MKIVLRHISQKSFWALLILCFIFFLLRFPSLYEPNWYGDEGIYQSIGYGLRSGRDFYTGVWDNKPPLLFVIYAIASGNQFNARFISLIFGIAAVITFYFLSRKIFTRRRSQLISTSFFVLFFGLPIIEGNIANSENFMLFPIILSANVLYTALCEMGQRVNRSKKWRLLIGGLILSLSFLIKIVTIFDFAAFLVFSFFIYFYAKEIRIKSFFHALYKYLFEIIFFIAGFLSPVLLSLIYFYFRGLLSYYVDAAFGRNVDYVGWANYFIIPQGLLYLRIIILGILLALLFVKRRSFAKPTLFIFIWLAFSLFNAFFSNRGYTHYMLLSLPSISLFIGMIFRKRSLYKKSFYVLATGLIIILLYFNFDHWTIKKTLGYYENFIKLTTGMIEYRAYQEFFDSRNPKDYLIAEYIKRLTSPGDVVFLWGNSAQIYPLSETLPPGRYSAAYHIVNSKESISETEKALIKNKPKYIIITQDLSYYPFNLSDYYYRITIEDSHIYEYAYK